MVTPVIVVFADVRFIPDNVQYSILAPLLAAIAIPLTIDNVYGKTYYCVRKTH